MRSLRVPNIFLLIPSQNITSVVDKIRHVSEVVAVFFDDGAGDDVYVQSNACQFFWFEAGGEGKGTARAQQASGYFLLVVRTVSEEGGVGGEPVCEVVFGEDGEVAGLGGGGVDEGYGFGVVEVCGQWLFGSQWMIVGTQLKLKKM